VRSFLFFDKTKHFQGFQLPSQKEPAVRRAS